MNTTNYDEIVPQMKYFICRHCTPEWVIDKAAILFVDLTYIFDGSVTYFVNDIPYRAEKGDLICIPKKSLRYAVTDPQNPMACYAANLWLTDFMGNDEKLPFPIVSKIGVHNTLMALYNDLNIEWLQKKPGYGLKVRSIFLDILHKYYRLIYYKDFDGDMDIRIKKAVDYIHINYNSGIRTCTLADLAGLNPSYFGTLFKASTGFSIKQYINRIRINNAENLLTSGEFSVKDVARRCGFADHFYFSKVYKKVKGYPPSKVKNNILSAK